LGTWGLRDLGTWGIEIANQLPLKSILFLVLYLIPPSYLRLFYSVVEK
jgi:hypothetical protein